MTIMCGQRAVGRVRLKSSALGLALPSALRESPCARPAAAHLDTLTSSAAPTLGLMFSSSPFFSLHRTWPVVSPPIPKFSAWSGEKSSRQICKQKAETNVLLQSSILLVRQRHHTGSSRSLRAATSPALKTLSTKGT